MYKVTINPPARSTQRPITIDDILSHSLGAIKLEICSVMLSGVYKPTKPEKHLSVGRKIYNIKRAINYHSKKDHRDDIIKIYYTRLIAQYSDGSQAVNRAEDIIRDTERFHTTTLFSTLLLDVVELQAHLNLLHCINEYQSVNHPDNLQLQVKSYPTSINQIFELLPFPRDLLAESILRLEFKRFRVYTNVIAQAPYLYCLQNGVTLESYNKDSVEYRKIPKGHVLKFDYGKLPYEIRNRRTRCDVIDYLVEFESGRLSTTYTKMVPWTNTIPESVVKHLSCVDKLKVAASGIRLELESCNYNLCICKSAIFRRMQLCGGNNDLDFIKLMTTYRFCTYALCLDQQNPIENLNRPAIPMALATSVIPWHAINRGSIV